MIGLQTNSHLAWPLAVLLTVALGGVIGLINGLLVTAAKIDFFIATLASGTFAFGITNWYSNGQQIAGARAGHIRKYRKSFGRRLRASAGHHRAVRLDDHVHRAGISPGRAAALRAWRQSAHGRTGRHSRRSKYIDRQLHRLRLVVWRGRRDPRRAASGGAAGHRLELHAAGFCGALCLAQRHLRQDA